MISGQKPQRFGLSYPEVIPNVKGDGGEGEKKKSNCHCAWDTMLNTTSVCLSALVKRLFLAICCLTVLYFFVMDCRQYFRIRNYAVRPTSGSSEEEEEYTSKIPCYINPLCTVTVKGLFLDYPNYYLLGPLAGLFDRTVGLSDLNWITPNAISVAHVGVAIAAAKCISSKSLAQRRSGVFLFQIRSWMDDLDGEVARKRMHVLGEHSDVGSTGYFVDGICDALGMTALFVGVFFYLRSNFPKHGYEKLQPMLPSINGKNVGGCVVYRKKIRVRNVALTVVLVVGSLLASSVAWNRYLYLYQDILETDEPHNAAISLEELHNRQTEVFRFNTFWIVSTFWRLCNPHAVIDYLLLAVFVDRLWDYVNIVRWKFYGVIVLVVYFAEFHYREILAFVTAGSAGELITSLGQSVAAIIHTNRTGS